MRIHKPGQDDFTRAVDFIELSAVLPDPPIAERIFRLAYGDNLPADTQNCAILDDAEFAKLVTPPGTAAPRRNSEQLPDVDQQQRPISFKSLQSAISIRNPGPTTSYKLPLLE